ncbi:MAG TPA: lactonase family protein, partial [Xanthobacteraceae bacterium]|nr:lactonase family protein [Xanthobacteraceae bacterium]
MLVYVGTYTEPIRFGTGQVLDGKGEGIYAFRLDPETGALELVGKTVDVANPSYLAFDATQRFLYAVNELKSYQGHPTGTVSAFALDPTTGGLKFVNKQPTRGADPCHVTVHPEGKYVFVANFTSGSIGVLPVRDDGGLQEASDFVQHHGSSIDPVRQNGPHAHSVTLDASGRYAFVPDLGLDKVVIYRFDAVRGTLAPNGAAWIRMKPGSGPRLLALDPGGTTAYLVNELSSTIAVLSLDRSVGGLRELQMVSTLPAGFAGRSTCADVQVSPSGRFVYASNRGHDSIAVYRADRRTGTL